MFVFLKIWRAPFWDFPFCLITDELLPSHNVLMISSNETYFFTLLQISVFLCPRFVKECLIIRHLSGNKLLIVLITFPLYILSALIMSISSAYTICCSRFIFGIFAHGCSRLGSLSLLWHVSANLQGIC